jgi:hypothetical protein
VAAAREQLVMAALLDHAPVLEHQDRVASATTTRGAE